MCINESALLTSEIMCEIILFSPLPLTSPLLPRGHLAGVVREVSVAVGELSCNMVVVFQAAPMIDQIMIAVRFRQLTLKKMHEGRKFGGGGGISA